MSFRKGAMLAALGVAPAASALAQGSPFQFAEPYLFSDFYQPAPSYEIAQTNTTVQQRRAEPSPPVTAPEPQRWSLSLGGLYTHREGETAGWLPNLEANYAATDRLQLHAMVPFAYDRTTGGGTHFGVGDVETGLRYRFIDDDPASWQPAVAFYPLVDFPSGKVNENLGTGRTHAFLPLWFSKSLGPWIPYAGGGYWINPGPANKNWAFFAAGVVRQIDEAWSLTGEVFHATSSKIGIPDQTGFDVGARYNVTDNHHIVLTVGRGLENTTRTNEFTGYLAYILTF